jgi:hydroxymethylglutaryl-CoA lyase
VQAGDADATSGRCRAGPGVIESAADRRTRDMSDLPKRVEIHEEGPREGFQIEPRTFPLAERAALVEALADAGLAQIQVASFVSPKRVPQMADAAELFAAIRKRPGTRYTALWLNEAGFDRARATPAVDVVGGLFFYASDAFARQNNGQGAAAIAESQRQWLHRYRAAGVAVESAYVMTAFGCNLEGEIGEARLAEVLRFIATLLADEGATLPKVYLADTVGWATPLAVRRRIDLVRELLPASRVGLHLHDTRGAGMANAFAALEHGVDLFDASVAGLGGCPFSGHADGSAAGNICTEDLAFLCEELGVATGIDLDHLVEAAQLAERIVGRRLAGKLMHAGTLRPLREQSTQRH